MKSRRHRAILKSKGYKRGLNNTYSKWVDCYNCNGFLYFNQGGDVEECSCKEGMVKDIEWTYNQEKIWERKWSKQNPNYIEDNEVDYIF